MTSLLRARSSALLAVAVIGAVVAAATPTRAVTFSVVYRFKGGSDGAGPSSSLLNVNGTLYGTTYEGGGTGCRKGNGCGTVYSITASGTETVLYRFQGYSDGALPIGVPTDVGGTLYGATTKGGGHGTGTVYSLTQAGIEKVTYRFHKKGSRDGAVPASHLRNVNGTLYGITEEGGDTACRSYGCGTVYSVTPDGFETVIHRFKGGSDGTIPYDATLLPVGNALYGTTSEGGSSGCNGLGCGTVFSIGDTGVETIVYAFSGGSDGSNPYSGLTEVGDTLYGTTSEGGNGGYGTVYTISSTGVENVLYSFKGPQANDGWNPDGGLINVGGTLYGTTLGGGGTGCTNYGCGTVYSITTSGVEKVLHSFTGGGAGEGPSESLLDVNGTLYGVAGTGDGGYGMVYKVQP